MAHSSLHIGLCLKVTALPAISKIESLSLSISLLCVAHYRLPDMFSIFNSTFSLPLLFMLQKPTLNFPVFFATKDSHMIVFWPITSKKNSLVAYVFSSSSFMLGMLIYCIEEQKPHPEDTVVEQEAKRSFILS